MNIPGFTAEASLYRTTRPYFMAATFEASVVSTNLYLQRVRGPSGPIGLPGQNCFEACLHLCMMSGGGSQACMSDCENTCSGTPGGWAGLFAA
jgi:hypothetical protein